MTTTSRYGKPNMAALPNDIGRRIINTILNTPAPDFERMHQDSVELEHQMKIERERRKNDEI